MSSPRSTSPAGLQDSSTPLCDVYDVAMLDLDGVVYVGPDAVPGVPAALARARKAGMQLAFVTNNAARTPDAVAAHLNELGVTAQADEVINSAQAAARYLAEHLSDGARVLVLGTTGLTTALREQGLEPVSDAKGKVDAVVQGYSPDMNMSLLAEGAVAVNHGALWVATNADPTIPSSRGPLPGNGSLVAALALATQTQPVVTGKPDPTMHRETLLRTGAKNPVVVGDRLDTDIEGANAVGAPSLLVFSGVSTVAELLAAAPKLRPSYLAADVSGLLTAHVRPDLADGVARCGAWSADATGKGLRLERIGGRDGDANQDQTRQDQARNGMGRVLLDDDALDAVRALCTAAWAADGTSADPSVSAGDDAAAGLLDKVGLSGR